MYTIENNNENSYLCAAYIFQSNKINLPVNSVGNGLEVLTCALYSVHLGWQNLIPYQIRHQPAEREKKQHFKVCSIIFFFVYLYHIAFIWISPTTLKSK